MVGNKWKDRKDGQIQECESRDLELKGVGHVSTPLQSNPPRLGTDPAFEQTKKFHLTSVYKVKFDRDDDDFFLSFLEAEMGVLMTISCGAR